MNHITGGDIPLNSRNRVNGSSEESFEETPSEIERQRNHVNDVELLALSGEGRDTAQPQPLATHKITRENIEAKLDKISTKKNLHDTAQKAHVVAIKDFFQGLGQILGSAILAITPFILIPPVAKLAFLTITDGFSRHVGSYKQGMDILKGVHEENILSPEKMEKLEHKQAILEKTLKLINLTEDERPDNLSFTDFLNVEWPNLEHTYELETLGEFAAIYEKKVALAQAEKKIGSPFTEAEKETLERLNLTPRIAEVTQNAILDGKLTRAQNKLEAHEKKREELLTQLNEMGVDTTSPLTIESSKAHAQEQQKAKNTDLNTQLDAIKQQEKDKVEQNKENARTIKTLKKELEDLNISLPGIRDKVNELLDSDHETLSRKENVAKKEAEIQKLENDQKSLKIEQDNLESQRLELLKKVEKNNVSITPLIVALRKTEVSLGPLRHSIVDLQSRQMLSPMILQQTATDKTEALKAENAEHQRSLTDLAATRFNDTQTFAEFKTTNNLATYQDVLNDPSEKNDVVIEALTEINRLETLIENNNQTINTLDSIVAKELTVRNTLLSNQAGKLDNYKKAFNAEMAAIKSLGHDYETLNEIKTALNELKAANEELKQDMTFDPNDFNEDRVRKQKNIDDYAKNMQNINNLEPRLRNLEKAQKEIDKLYDRISPTEEEISSDLHELKNKMIGNVPSAFASGDLRMGSLALEKWQKKSITLSKDLPTTIDPVTGHSVSKVDVKTNAINVFGTYNPPEHGKFLKNPNYGATKDPNAHKEYLFSGEWVGRSKADLATIGGSTENNFLSNSYDTTPLNVDGKDYKTVMHYMVIKKLEKDITYLELHKPSGYERQVKTLQKKKVMAENSPSAFRAFDLLVGFEVPYRQSKHGVFDGLDDELKKALYSKFVGPDGTPSAEGKKLLATGNTMLYAGNELGDSSYGMEFITKNEMHGENKLGVCLMELRDSLRNEGRKLAEYERLEPESADYAQRVQMAGILDNEKVETFKIEGMGVFQGVSVFDEEENKKKPLKGTLFYTDGARYVGKFINGRPGNIGTDGQFFPPREGRNPVDHEELRAEKEIKKKIADLGKDYVGEEI